MSRVFLNLILMRLLILVSVALCACNKIPDLNQINTSEISKVYISGRVSAAPIRGAVVRIYSLGDDMDMGDYLGRASADDDGNFSLQVATNKKAIAIVATGGSYLEEADGAPVELNNLQMISYVPVQAVTRITTSVTPLTQIAVSRALVLFKSTGDAQSAITTANQEIALAAGLGAGTDITLVKPAHPRQPLADQGFALDSLEAKYAVFLAGLSILAHHHGGNSLQLMALLSDDFRNDGAFDGLDQGVSLVLPDANLLTTTNWLDLPIYQSEFLRGSQNLGGFDPDILVRPYQ